MGWDISHGNSPHGTNHRSAGAMYEVGQHVAHIVSAAEWRAVEPLFRLANHAGGPFEIPARDAKRIAGVLRKAANHRLMPRTDSAAVRELADAAQRAADSGQSWEWI